MKSCSPADLKDYVLGEMAPAARTALEQHLSGCSACLDEVRILNLTQAALLGVGEEEPPRRIAFVSDPVFEPRWWQRIWKSGPQLGFLSAVILSAAILTHAFVRQPSPAPRLAEAPAHEVSAAPVSDQEIANRIQAAIAASEQRQSTRFQKVIAAREKDFEFQRRADRAEMEAYVDYWQKRATVVQRAGLQSGAEAQ